MIRTATHLEAEMRVEQKHMLEILSAPQTTYAIPKYQRKYSWREKQCRELWLDLMRAARSNTDHFAGMFLYNEDVDASGDSSQRRVSVVDGQQRITTVNLLVRALAEHQKTCGTLEDVPSAAELEERYVQSFSPDEVNRNTIANLAFFRSQMDEESFDARALWEGLGHLMIIAVQLDPSEEPQPIFESLNSKGARLTIADMIRNYLLAAETHGEQTRLYDEYWTPIEGSFYPDPGSLRLDSMIKAWLTIRVRRARARTADDAYNAFKLYIEDDWTGGMEPILSELRSFAVIWAENYRYHAVKKFKSMKWAQNGAQTLTSGYKLVEPTNKEYAERVRRELEQTNQNF